MPRSDESKIEVSSLDTTRDVCLACFVLAKTKSFVGVRRVHLMMEQLLGVSAVSFAIVLGTTVIATPVAVADTYCGESSRGASVYAGNADTSCGFAISTAEAYHAYGNGSHPFSVYSPVTGLTYMMTCTNAGSVCQGGNDALVYLR